MTVVSVGMVQALSADSKEPRTAFSEPTAVGLVQPGNTTPRDHVCGGGVLDCAACCIDKPGVPPCLEISRTDCVVMFGGNPQELGSDCHDFSGDGVADACEPDFPLCLPSPDGFSCDGYCPGPLPCVPSKVRVNLTTFAFEVLECVCRPGCRVCLECDAFPPPCAEGCPQGEACHRTETCFGEICDVECHCVPAEACCLPFPGLTCQMMAPSDCLAAGGEPGGPNSACQGDGACCLDIDDGPFRYDTCLEADGACCPAAPGGAFQGVGTACAVQSCCLPGGGCQELDPACCAKSGGVAGGPGSQCDGTQACCYVGNLIAVCVDLEPECCQGFGGVLQGVNTLCSAPRTCCLGGFCFEIDPLCCDELGGVVGPAGSLCSGEGACCYDADGDFIPESCIQATPECCANVGGNFHGPGSTCSPNFGACCFGFACCSCAEMNETCCANIEAGTFHGNGSICLGDNNGNGIDDVCDPGTGCAPNPAGNACNPTVCLNTNQFCVPTKVKCTPSGAVCTIIECACQDPNLCHIDLPPGSPLPACLGDCPTGQICREVITIDPDGQFLHSCTCEAPEACCLTSFSVTCQLLLPSECMAFGGIPQGPGSICLGHEACCLPDGSCTFVDAVCCDDLGGSSQGSGSMCSGTAPGPCCFDITDDFCIYDTCVAEQDPLCCTANGGIPLGDDTNCDPQACCIDGLCCDIQPDCCVISGGVPGGLGSSCAGVQGACCYDGDGDGIAEVCILADAACCADLGGLFHGPGSTCSPNFGACCFGQFGGSCVEMNESCCGDINGSFRGNSSTCLGDSDGDGMDDACFPPDQACCLGAVYNHACIFVVPGACLSKGGIPQGIGTDCTAPQACCMADGSCRFLDPLCCDNLGGTPSGPGMVCRPYGDISPKPAGDGFVDVGDILKVLDGFADPAAYPNADIHPCCTGDGKVDVGDVIAALDAFTGNPACPDQSCPCAP